jgi:hypothetical protein
VSGNPAVPEISEHPEASRARVTKILTNESAQTGVYYDEKGDPMLGSELVRDPKFNARVVTETRALLSTVR